MLGSSQDHNTWSTRERDYHLATPWTHGPRWNYSQIIPEEGMAMKNPLGSISTPAGCRNQLQDHPRTRFYGGGDTGWILWKIMATSTFLGLMWIYRRRRGPRGCPMVMGGSHPRVALGTRQGAAPGLWVAPQAPLWCPGDFHRVKIPDKFSEI